MDDPTSPEHWHRLSDLFHRAMQHEPDRRAAFLDDACRDDPSMRSEVLSLLAFREQSSDGLTSTPTPVLTRKAATGSLGGSLVGRTLHQYTVKKKLAEGGMGVVYLADDTRLGRPVALKALTVQFMRDDERRERLRREARAAAGLSDPRIATVYALEEFDNDLYLVSEYVPGVTLRDELSQGPLPLGTLLTTGLEMARALATAHGRGVIHRDLKPENIIRTPAGGIKVLDFGLARIGNTDPDPEGSPHRLTEPGTILGTPGYIAPEQLRGARVDARADLFAFGVMLYELASGVHPFARADSASTIARVLECDPPNLSALGRTCPPGLDDLIRTCLQKDPALRFSSTAELVHALEALCRDSAEPTSRPPTAPLTGSERTSDRSRSNPLAWWRFHQAAVAVVYSLMLVPVWTVQRELPRPWGGLLFFSAVAAVGVAATLRLHLSFTSRFYPAELTSQRHRVFWPTRVADSVFVLLLVTGATLNARPQPIVTAALIAVAAASVVAFLVIEPATARAAFGRREPGPLAADSTRSSRA